MRSFPSGILGVGLISEIADADFSERYQWILIQVSFITHKVLIQKYSTNPQDQKDTRKQSQENFVQEEQDIKEKELTRGGA